MKEGAQEFGCKSGGEPRLNRAKVMQSGRASVIVDRTVGRGEREEERELPKVKAFRTSGQASVASLATDFHACNAAAVESSRTRRLMERDIGLAASVIQLGTQISTGGGIEEELV